MATEIEKHTHWLNAIYEIARTMDFDEKHFKQVTNFALKLFDQLYEIHHLSKEKRNYLEYASLLHDIGWVEGWKDHNKKTLNIILKTSLLPFDAKEKLIIGSIARYHRGSYPSQNHDHYMALESDDRNFVLKLSSILRLADGLDSSHQNIIKDVETKINSNNILLFCYCANITAEEKEAILKKSDLFTHAFSQYKLKVVWEVVNTTNNE